MKTVPQAFLDQIDHARVLTGARAVVRSNRLKFATKKDISHTDSFFESLVGTADEDLLYRYDADIVTSDTRYHSPILRIRVRKSSGTYYLSHQYITDPTADISTWNHWVDDNIIVAPNCKPGVFDNRIFYMQTDGLCLFRDYDYTTDTWGAIHSYCDKGTGTEIIGFAPTSKTYVILKQIWSVDPAEPPPGEPPAPDYDRTQVELWYNLDATPAQAVMQSLAYGEFDSLRGFDAVRLSGSLDYIFFAGDKGQRAEYIVRDSVHWSQIHHVINLDIIEDEAAFMPQFASLINGIPFLTMTITRKDGGTFQGFTMGPAPFTLGRDVFITSDTVGHDGKLFPIHNAAGSYYIYYLGPNTCYVAESVNYTGGVDTATNKLDTGKIDDFTIEYDKNNSSVFQFYVGGTAKDSPLMAPGNDVDLYVSIGNQEAKLGSFTIDSVSVEKHSGGAFKTVAGRGAGGKKIAQWTSDAYYDLWSQTKQSCNPVNLDEMIRLQGLFSASGAVTEPNYGLRLDDLNKDGMLYTAMKSSKGSIQRGRFVCITNETNYTPEVGVWANLYRHTDNAEGDNTLYVSGIKAVVGPGVWSIQHIYKNASTVLSSGSWTMPNNTPFWLELEYVDGMIKFRHKLDTDIAWISFAAVLFTHEGYSPYGTPNRDGLGRGGLNYHNYTPNSTSPGFATDDTVIPVVSSSPFPDTCTVIVDNEQIDVSGKCLHLYNYDPARDKTVCEGTTFMQAPHDNENWVNGVIMQIPIGDVEAEQPFMSATSTKYLSWCFYHTGQITIDKIQLRIKKVGNPVDNVYVYLVTDDWDNGNSPDFGAVLTTAYRTAGTFTTSFQWVEFTFATPQTLPPPDHGGYWFVLTNVAPGVTPPIDANNYYVVSINEDTQFIEGYFFLWDGGTPHWLVRTPIGKPSYKMIGTGNGGDGYEIYCSSIGGNYARDYFDNAAFVVLDGAGKGSVFKIQDYDYKAPKQWTPSRFYNPPDRWQDHVGDPAHGSWTQPNAMRFFVDQDPSGVIAPGSKMGLYPGLVIIQRATNETVATSHGADAVVSYYTSTSVTCDRFQYFSTDIDLRLEDVVNEIARKAGVIKPFLPQKLYSGAYTKGTAGDITARIEHRNPIIRHTVENGPIIYTAFHYTYDGANYINGKYFAISNTHIQLKDAAGTILMEWDVPTGPVEDYVLVSIQEDNYSVWFKDVLVATYHDDSPPTGSYCWVACSAATTVNLDWSACDRRVDNFSLDGGTRGDQLISQLINQKRYYWLDTADGGIKLFHTNDSIPDKYYLTAVGAMGQSEQDLVTRIRVMGLEEYETFDPTSMQEYGNLYGEANIEDAENLAESKEEADKILEDYLGQFGRHQLTGAADPRLEPMDIIGYDTGDGDKQMKIATVSLAFSLADDNPTFDMKLEGYDA